MGKLPFIPVINHETYLRDMKRHYGEDDPQVLELVEKYRSLPPIQPPRNPRRDMKLPESTDHVCVSLTVLKTGKVRAKVEAPMANLFSKYYTKGLKPPVDEHIRALKAFGYPDDILERVLEKEQKGVDNTDIDLIFSKYSKKSSSKPKKLSVRESLNKKIKASHARS